MKLTIKKYNEYDFKVRSTLHDDLWDGDSLKEEVKQTLLKIAEEFIQFVNLDLTKEDIEDIQFTGSLANYNYTKFSDIDLHILIDFSVIDENEELVKELLMSKKLIWNSRFPIKVKGFEVEVYPQSIGEIHHSTGVYSILNDEWKTKPEKSTSVWSTVNLSDIRKKVHELAHDINNLEADENKLENIKRIKEKIKRMRQAGLETGGEYSTENLVFKVLRRTGLIKKLYDLGREEYRKSLSLNGLEEKAEWWRNRRAMDKKNLRVLIGHGTGKLPKHAKKGGPFTSSPKKYPGAKAAPGLGLLESNESVEEQLMKIIMAILKKLFGKSTKTKKDVAADKEVEERGLTTDQEADLKMTYKELRNKFIGYKGEETGFRGYIHFIWDQYDKNRDNPLIKNWTREKTYEHVKLIAPKYGIEPYIPMGVMAGESGHHPTGIFGQTRGRKGHPDEGIRANSTAFGMGGVTQTAYESIKHQVGVPHYMIWDPRYGIEANVAMIAANLKLFKGNLSKAMNMYAGTKAGGRRKMAAIAKAKKHYA